MRIMKRIFALMFVLVSIVFLSGCPDDRPVTGISITCPVGGANWSRCKIKTMRGPRTQGVIDLQVVQRFAMSQAVSIDPSSIYLDLAGTDYATDQAGAVAITLYDVNGAIIAAQSFTWIKSGTKLIPQNSAAISAWIANYPSADDYDVSLTPGGPPADGIEHTLIAAAYYQNALQATAIYSFAATCSDPRTHQVSLCAQ